MDYFHVAPTILGMGSIIMPGNWGRVIRLYNWEGSSLITTYRELALEQARMMIAPKAPSRLGCVYACETIEGALKYRATNALTSLIYRVQKVDAASPVFRTSWALIGSSPVEGASPLPVLGENIQRYWIGNPDNDVEVLIGGPVRVEGVIL